MANFSTKDIQTLIRAGNVTIDGAHSANPLGLGLDAYYDIKSEFELQTAVITECKKLSLTDPDYGRIFAVPNGQYRPGQRVEAGLVSGAPDLFLYVARGGYHGCFIELKFGRNKLSPNQVQMLAELKAQGYYCVVVKDSVDAVMNTIRDYLAQR